MSTGPRCRLAVAVASPDEARRAMEAGADYVLAPAKRERPAFGVPERMQADTAIQLHFAIAADETLPAEPRRVARLQEPCDPVSLTEAGYAAALLDPERSLLRAMSLEAVAGFAAACHAAGLECWLGGALELPDIPRLLVLRPDALVFAGLDPAGLARALTMMQPVDAPDLDGPLDRILVRNFVLPFQIGAYGFEHGRTQRVRFNVEADVRRRRGVPKELGDVYSYDIVTDAIRRLAERGHTDLVEAVAEELAAELLRDPRLASVCVRVEKLDLGPEAVGIEIRRTRDNASID